MPPSSSPSPTSISPSSPLSYDYPYPNDTTSKTPSYFDIYGRRELAVGGIGSSSGGGSSDQRDRTKGIGLSLEPLNNTSSGSNPPSSQHCPPSSLSKASTSTSAKGKQKQKLTLGLSSPAPPISPRLSSLIDSPRDIIVTPTSPTSPSASTSSFQWAVQQRHNNSVKNRTGPSSPSPSTPTISTTPDLSRTRTTSSSKTSGVGSSTSGSGSYTTTRTAPTPPPRFSSKFSGGSGGDSYFPVSPSIPSRSSSSSSTTTSVSTSRSRKVSTGTGTGSGRSPAMGYEKERKLSTAAEGEEESQILGMGRNGDDSISFSHDGDGDGGLVGLGFGEVERGRVKDKDRHGVIMPANYPTQDGISTPPRTPPPHSVQPDIIIEGPSQPQHQQQTGLKEKNTLIGFPISFPPQASSPSASRRSPIEPVFREVDGIYINETDYSYTPADSFGGDLDVDTVTNTPTLGLGFDSGNGTPRLEHGGGREKDETVRVSDKTLLGRRLLDQEKNVTTNTSRRKKRDAVVAQRNDTVVASVSTDMMDSFIEAMNPSSSRNRTSSRVSRSGSSLLDSTSTTGSSSRRSSLIPPEDTQAESHITVPSLGPTSSRLKSKPSLAEVEPKEIEGLPWKRHGHTYSTPKRYRNSLNETASEYPRVVTEASQAELMAIATELGGTSFGKKSLPPTPKVASLSIDDIIKKHSNATPHAFGLRRGSTAEQSNSITPSPTKSSSLHAPTPPPKPTRPVSSMGRLQRSPVQDSFSGNALHRVPTSGSVDSIGEAALASNLLLERLERVDEHAPSPAGSIRVGGKRMDSYASHASSIRSRRYDTSNRSVHSSNSANSWETLRRGSGGGRDSPGPSTDATSLAAYIKSHRLTRMITLPAFPFGIGQQVSIADVGDSNGYPVVVFLGLGCVRYLVALFDEIATAVNIRLICIDRWGLGRSTEVPDERRGLFEWARVVEEVLNQLDIDRFGILAHSAGAPYAMATSLRMRERVVGKIHLLSPWVNVEVDGSYKWLRYVPSGIIRTAQATEWKLQGWMLGKLPQVQQQGIGYNANAPAEFDVASGIHNIGGTNVLLEDDADESYDDLADFSGRYSSTSSLPDLDPVSPTRKSRPPPPVTPSRELSTGAITGMLGAVSKLSSAPLPTSPTKRMLKRQSNPGGISSKDYQFGDSNTESNVNTLSRKSSRRSFLGGSPVASQSKVSLPPRSETPFVVSLLQASHAEALAGGTADLLTILGKDSKPWGFSYKDIRHPCKIWFGDKDDKISERSMRWLEKEMHDAELSVIKGEGHNLMTSSVVMIEVLESLSDDGRALKLAVDGRERHNVSKV